MRNEITLEIEKHIFILCQEWRGRRISVQIVGDGGAPSPRTHTNFVIFACLYVHYIRPNTHYFWAIQILLFGRFLLDFVVVACSIFHLIILRLYTHTHTQLFVEFVFIFCVVEAHEHISSCRVVGGTHVCVRVLRLWRLLVLPVHLPVIFRVYPRVGSRIKLNRILVNTLFT